MGFSPPKPDPTLVAQQNAAATQAKQQKISLLQNQLSDEDQLRQRVYGLRTGSLFGQTAQSGQGVSPLLTSLFGGG